mgnify:CR=1 FL=1
MSKIKSFYNLIKKLNLNLVKLILLFLLLKTYPCFATNNLIITINDTKIILKIERICANNFFTGDKDRRSSINPVKNTIVNEISIEKIVLESST